MKNKEFSVRDTQLSITDIRAHLCHQWEMFFPPTDSHRFGYMLSVFICVISGNIFSPTDFHRFSQIWLHVIRAHLCHQWGNVLFSHGLNGFHGFVFLVAANALGIGAASFWSVSGKRYSGKPDGVAGTPKEIYS